MLLLSEVDVSLARLATGEELLAVRGEPEGGAGIGSHDALLLSLDDPARVRRAAAAVNA